MNWRAGDDFKERISKRNNLGLLKKGWRRRYFYIINDIPAADNIKGNIETKYRRLTYDELGVEKDYMESLEYTAGEKKKDALVSNR